MTKRKKGLEQFIKLKPEPKTKTLYQLTRFAGRNEPLFFYVQKRAQELKCTRQDFIIALIEQDRMENG